MEYRTMTRLCALALSASLLGASPVIAQATGGTGATAGSDPAMATQTTDTRRDDDGTDWGWIGLLGLAGLLGLRRRDTHVHHDTTTTTGRSTTGARV